MKTSRFFGTLAMLIVAVPVLLALCSGSTTPPEVAAEARLTDSVVITSTEAPDDWYLPKDFLDWCPNPGQDGGCGTVCGPEGAGRWGVCWEADMYDGDQFIGRSPSFPCLCGKTSEATVKTGHEGVLIAFVNNPRLGEYLRRYDAFVGENGINSFTEAVCARDGNWCSTVSTPSLQRLWMP